MRQLSRKASRSDSKLPSAAAYQVGASILNSIWARPVQPASRAATVLSTHRHRAPHKKIFLFEFGHVCEGHASLSGVFSIERSRLMTVLFDPGQIARMPRRRLLQA